MADARNTQQFVEQVESAETPSIRSTQQFVEQIESAETPSIRNTQQFVEQIESEETPSIRVTQLFVETLLQADTFVVNTQLFVEDLIDFELPSIAITPDPATMVATVVDPTIQTALLAIASMDTDGPSVVLGSISITPDPATAIILGPQPQAYHGWVITPEVAAIVATGVDPNLVGTFITVRRYVMRVAEQDYGLPGILHLKCDAENPRIYSAISPGGYGLGMIPGSIPQIGQSGVYLMDVPIFQDTQDDAGFYVGSFPTTGDPDAWKGSTLLESNDGEDWQPLTSFDISAVAGIAETALPDVTKPGQWDETSSITVKLYYGELENVTPLQALNGSNAALIGNEIVEFTTVESLEHDRYEISGFIRARQGTYHAVSTHQANERFILLNPLTVQRPMAPASELNVPRFYKVQSHSGLVDDSGPIAFTNTGVGLKPRAPCSPLGSRDGSNNLTIDFCRCSRIRGTWNLATDPPLGEESESYEADVYDTGWTTVERTLTSTTQQFTYSAILQSLDGLTPGDPVNLKIYQLSELVGRGFPLQCVV